MIPNRNDRSEGRLGMKVLQQLRSPYSARTEKVKTDVVFMQVRFPQIDFTSNLAHRKHASSPTHPHPFENTSWLHPIKKSSMSSRRFSSSFRSKLTRATAATASLKAWHGATSRGTVKASRSRSAGRHVLLDSICCFSAFSVLVANPKKLLYTVEKRTKEKVWQHTPHPRYSSFRQKKKTRRFYSRHA